jgi:hypothetical protein
LIIQRVLKGISNLSETDAKDILKEGILCNWLQKSKKIPVDEVPKRLSDRNAEWHQEHYKDKDPDENGEEFYLHTPFISTTAGSVERQRALSKNLRRPAWEIALKYATADWTANGYLFYCHVFIVGRPAVALQNFSEELRELHVYPRYSRHQVEGEILAKIIIPPAQIEKAEYWSLQEANDAVQNGKLPAPDPLRTLENDLFVKPEMYNNVRDFLS